jgi:hypothetical protein
MEIGFDCESFYRIVLGFFMELTIEYTVWTYSRYVHGFFMESAAQSVYIIIAAISAWWRRQYSDEHTFVLLSKSVLVLEWFGRKMKIEKGMRKREELGVGGGWVGGVGSLVCNAGF